MRPVFQNCEVRIAALSLRRPQRCCTAPSVPARPVLGLLTLTRFAAASLPSPPNPPLQRLEEMTVIQLTSFKIVSNPPNFDEMLLVVESYTALENKVRLDAMCERRTRCTRIYAGFAIALSAHIRRRHCPPWRRWRSQCHLLASSHHVCVCLVV